MKTLSILYFIFLPFLLLPSYSQEALFFKNPSFEGTSGYATVPPGWGNCAFNNETPPDIYPVKDGFFRVHQQPKNGATYIGLVGRDYGRTESIGQKLLTPLQAGQCYEFSAWLSKSDSLLALHRHTRKRTNFNQPLVLAIWGGISPCGKKQLLAVSPIVDHLDWKKYRFQIYPKENCTHISFAANFSDKIKETYNGNILIDHLSPIVPMDCQTKKLLIDTSNLDIPQFKYIKYKIPKKRNWDALIFLENKIEIGKYFNIVDHPEKIKTIIDQNCGEIGFKKNSAQLIDGEARGLFEIIFNCKKFNNTFLTIYLDANHEKILSRRKRVINRIMIASGLAKNKFTIKSVFKNKTSNNYRCNKNGIGLEIYN